MTKYQNCIVKIIYALVWRRARAADTILVTTITLERLRKRGYEALHISFCWWGSLDYQLAEIPSCR